MILYECFKKKSTISDFIPNIGYSTTSCNSTYSNVVATYFVVVGMLGLEQYGNRCISRVRDNYEERSSVFSELITLHALISVIVIMIYVLYVAFLVDEFRDVFAHAFWYQHIARNDYRHPVYVSLYGMGRLPLGGIFGSGTIFCHVRCRVGGGGGFAGGFRRAGIFKGQSSPHAFFIDGRHFVAQHACMGVYCVGYAD